MSIKKRFKTLLGQISSRNNAARYKQDYIHPEREWAIGLVMFVVVLGAGAVYSWYLFQQVDMVARDIVVSENQIVTYREKSIEQTLATYREQGRVYQELRSGIVQASVSSATSSAVVVTKQSTASSTEAIAGEDGEAEGSEGDEIVSEEEGGESVEDIEPENDIEEAM